MLQKRARRGDGPIFPEIGNLDVLDAVKNSDHWNTPINNGKNNNGKLKGRGIASGYWMNGGGKSSATLSVNDDGTVSLLEGSADIGGTRSSIAMHVAEVLGLKAEDIIPRIPDTDGVGYTGMTGGSRTTYATGMAAYQAAESLVEKFEYDPKCEYCIKNGKEQIQEQEHHTNKLKELESNYTQSTGMYKVYKYNNLNVGRYSFNKIAHIN